MNQTLAIFNNRTHTMSFSKLLKQIGIKNNIITTPRELSVSCGISVIFPYSQISKASLLINQYKLNSFVSFYLVIHSGVYKKYKKL